MGLTRELRDAFFANLPQLLAPKSSPPEARAARPAIQGRLAVPVPVASDEMFERFYRMLSLNEIILRAPDAASLWSSALEIALTLSGAERAFLLLRQAGGGFDVAASRGEGGGPIAAPELEVSLTIAQEAARTGRTVVTVNAREDDRFHAALSVVDLDLTSVLCVPVRDADGLLGALYLDHRFQPGLFPGELQRMMEAFGHQVALAITNHRRVSELERERQTLAATRDELDTLLQEREAALVGLEHRVALLSDEVARGRDDQRGRPQFASIAYTSRAMEGVLRQVERIARGDVPVVVIGESGTGKELIAEALHQASPRSSGPFVAFNCGAVTESLFESEMFGHVKGAFTGATLDREGLFQAASGGTLFLDELGELPLTMQVKLLRVLQERKVRRVGSTRSEPIDVRIVAATNRDLSHMVREETFREDLYYRLAAFVLHLPPLRDRREDIPLIAHALLERLGPDVIGRPVRLSPEAAYLLRECAWPGNVRELENTLRAACVLCDDDVITERELATLVRVRGSEEAPARGGATPRPKVGRFSRARKRGRRSKHTREGVLAALEEADGDYDVAAAALEVSLRTLYRYVDKYEL